MGDCVSGIGDEIPGYDFDPTKNYAIVGAMAVATVAAPIAAVAAESVIMAAAVVAPRATILGLDIGTAGPTGMAVGTGAVAGKVASVWEKVPTARGREIENMLGGNLPSNFPVVDKLANGTVTSTKSIDTTLPGYQNVKNFENKLNGYADKAAAFTQKTWSGVSIKSSDYASKALEVAIPNAGTAAQQQAFSNTIDYARGLGVALVTKVIK